jgi:hypothetical protein
VGLIRERAAERLAEAMTTAGGGDLPAAAGRDAQPTRRRPAIGTSREIDARDLIKIAEDGMSAPVFEPSQAPG